MSRRSRSFPSEPAADAGSAAPRTPRASEPSRGAAGSQPEAGAAGDRADAPAQALPPGLYVVATPIGNLGDLSYRAHDHLGRVDAVLCEDTRVTAKLLRAYGLAPPTLSYHEHNAEARRPEVLQRLQRGQALALVSDAGTPLVSDPGYKLVRAVQEAGHPVAALPGASAALAALVVSGLPSDRFFFQGFLPAKAGARDQVLAELAGLQASLILYESPKRLPRTLALLAERLGDREAAVARELTKRFEEVHRDRLSALAAGYAAPPKGEVAIVVGPPEADRAAPDPAELDARLHAALAEFSLRDAVQRVSADTGLRRKQVYQRALALSRES
jgi:16S rRNA (cytidine1402-2'-O)-methyltransferase